MTREPSAAQKMIGDIAPKLADLTDRVLFGEVWEGAELSKRDQLRFHLRYALQNGVKKQELIEVITHLAFYAGWPNAMSAITVAKEVLSKA